MEPEEDYFGDIAVPEGFEDDDAANDVTFGDTDDIKAGDPDSDALWKADHEARAHQIEREREALLQSQTKNDLLSSAPRPEHNAAILATSVPVMTADPQVLVQVQPRLSQLPQLLQPPQLPQLPQPPIHHPQQYPLHFTPHHPVSYLHHDAPHYNSAYMQQLHLAQQYNLMHQQQQALIEQQRRMMVAHHHSYIQPEGKWPMMGHGQNHILPHTQDHASVAAVPVETSRGLMGPHPFPDSSTRDAPLVGGKTHQEVEQQLLNSGRSTTSQTQHSRTPDAPVFSGARTVEEIERQMFAQMRPDPRASNSSSEKQHDISAQLRSLSMLSAQQNRKDRETLNKQEFGRPHDPPPVEYASSSPSPRPFPRIELMTDKDLEVVLRMHLRQLEVAVPYKDDYYAYAVRESYAAGWSDAFSALAVIVADMGTNSGQQVNGRRLGPKGGRPRVHTIQNGDGHDSAHIPGNISTLANALGVLQVWNPKAPRKLVDFGHQNVGPSSDALNRPKIVARESESRFGPFGFSPAKTLLRDDDRIATRAAVEHGYDIIGTIHDVARRKVNSRLDPLLDKLFAVLRIPSSHSGSVKAQPSNLDESFFLRLCGFRKGQFFVMHALDLFRPSQKVASVCMVMRKLGVFLLADSKRKDSDVLSDAFWSCLNEIVESTILEPVSAVYMLQAFDTGHKCHGEQLGRAIGTERGSQLVYSAMRHVYYDISNGSLSNSDPLFLQMIGGLCSTLTDALGDIFDHAESASGVWQVLALLDALATPEEQMRLRSCLKQLLEAGRAPAPPA